MNITIKRVIGTCASPEVAQIAELKGKKFPYSKAKKAIKLFSPELYKSLAMDFRNPWADCTNIKKSGELHVIYSLIDYIFEIEAN